MDVTSLCSRLVAIMVLLAAQVKTSLFAQSAGEALPRITPDRLQFFEYETVHISCEKLMSLTGWRVKHRLNKINSTISDICTPPAPSCTIELPFEHHSGEFWCENDEGNITGSINISVTAGSVILDFPAHPVKEGSDVTFFCRRKNKTLTHIADFYKDGVHKKTKYDKNLIIRNVSESHAGLYKCSISGSGQSPESWLTVSKETNNSDKRTKKNPDKGIEPWSPDLFILVLISIGISIVIILLLVIGLYRHQNREAFLLSRKSTRGSHSQEDHTVLGGDTDPDQQHATYAAVNKPKKKGGGDADDVTYADVELHNRNNEPSNSSKGKKNKLSDDSVVYSFITFGPSEQD